ncbi:hypothetical protein ACFCZT_34610 [Streptomyces sp. NPDC056230]|uniref:hypothetical protein n=1 Tax=Streptomyces sp. NPDC056230 TaxID=3345754 RepID=UPI0035DF0DC5
MYAVPKEILPAMPPGVYQFDGYDGNGQPSWGKIGGSNFTGVATGNWGVLSSASSGGDLWHYTGTPNQWEVIAPGAALDTVAIGKDTVYRRGQDWGIHRYDGFGTTWTALTGPLVGHAVAMNVGNWGFVYSDFDVKTMYRFVGDPGGWTWAPIGPHRPSFAVADDTVYAISLDESTVYRYDGQGTSWTDIGGPTPSDWIVACP